MLEVLALAAGEALGLEASVGSSIEVPRDAFNRRRGQYLGEGFLDSLAAWRRGPGLLLGITEADLFLPRLNFVFGVADRFRGVAVVSMHRLRPEFYGDRPDERLFRERILKESIHELGHVLGLTHCEEPDCIMHFSNSIGDTDRKGPGFCGKCQGRLA